MANRATPAAGAHHEPVTEAHISHQRIQTNGIGMHIAEAGTGPPVVVVHGFSRLWDSWGHPLRVLRSAGYRAVALDLRGCGETDVPQADESYTVSNLAADVIGVLDALDAEHAVLVGHDWGGNIGWACAELYPQRVSAVVALSVPYKPRPP